MRELVSLISLICLLLFGIINLIGQILLPFVMLVEYSFKNFRKGNEMYIEKIGDNWIYNGNVISERKLFNMIAKGKVARINMNKFKVV